MAGKNFLNKQLIDAISSRSSKFTQSSVAKSFAEEGQKAVVEQVIKGAVVGATAATVWVVRSRRSPRQQRSVTIYRLLHKLRVIGEDALALENEGLNDERQRVVADAAVLRNDLHEQLLDLHVSAVARTSAMLDIIEPAVKDADRLMAALNKWALTTADASRSPALLEAVRALAESENALRSHLRKSRRRRTRKGPNGHTANGELTEG